GSSPSSLSHAHHFHRRASIRRASDHLRHRPATIARPHLAPGDLISDVELQHTSIRPPLFTGATIRDLPPSRPSTGDLTLECIYSRRKWRLHSCSLDQSKRFVGDDFGWSSKPQVPFTSSPNFEGSEWQSPLIESLDVEYFTLLAGEAAPVTREAEVALAADPVLDRDSNPVAVTGLVDGLVSEDSFVAWRFMTIYLRSANTNELWFMTIYLRSANTNDCGWYTYPSLDIIQLPILTASIASGAIVGHLLATSIAILGGAFLAKYISEKLVIMVCNVVEHWVVCRVRLLEWEIEVYDSFIHESKSDVVSKALSKKKKKRKK
ncbi:5-methyltetrahydropteroyltriglutamate--homocysteine methyltransferase, partial [Striga asiatica]